MLPVFVYGTLRFGEGNWAWALSGRTISHDRAVLHGAQMRNNRGAFPFVNRSESLDDIVVGDLFTIDPAAYEATLDALDALEGYRGPGNEFNMYDRVEVDVVTDSGLTVHANTYLCSQRLFESRVQSLDVIASGDWLNRTQCV